MRKGIWFFLLIFFALNTFGATAYPPQGEKNLNLKPLAGTIEVELKKQEIVNEKGKEQLNKATEKLLKVAGGGKVPVLEMRDPTNPNKKVIYEFDKDTGHLIEVIYQPSKTTVSSSSLTPKKVDLNKEAPAKKWAKLFAGVVYLFGTVVILVEAFLSFASRSYVWGFFYLFVGTIASALMYAIYKLL